MQRRRRGGREAAVISTLTSVFGKALESSVESSWHPFGVRGRGRCRCRGRGRFEASNPAAGSSKYLCLCFIYLHCQNQFCPRVQLFFTFMPEPLSGPCASAATPLLLLVSDTHAKRKAEKCCLFSIKNLSSSIAWSSN